MFFHFCDSVWSASVNYYWRVFAVILEAESGLKLHMRSQKHLTLNDDLECMADVFLVSWLHAILLSRIYILLKFAQVMFSARCVWGSYLVKQSLS